MSTQMLDIRVWCHARSCVYYTTLWAFSCMGANIKENVNGFIREAVSLVIVNLELVVVCTLHDWSGAHTIPKFFHQEESMISLSCLVSKTHQRSDTGNDPMSCTEQYCFYIKMMCRWFELFARWFAVKKQLKWRMEWGEKVVSLICRDCAAPCLDSLIFAVWCCSERFSNPKCRYLTSWERDSKISCLCGVFMNSLKKSFWFYL